MRRSFPKTKGLRRRGGDRELQPELMVVCEGKTEKDLLEGLRSRWRIASAKIEIMAQVGVPSTVVERAVELKRERGRDQVEVWAVFDRDEHPCFKRAILRAEQCGIKLALSNPCFELWGLLLHGDQTAALDRHAAQRLLRELDKRYDHERSPVLDVAFAVERLDAAAGRAEVIRRRAEQAGDPFGCPVTTFDRLIGRLRALS